MRDSKNNQPPLARVCLGMFLLLVCSTGIGFYEVIDNVRLNGELQTTRLALKESLKDVEVRNKVALEAILELQIKDEKQKVINDRWAAMYKEASDRSAMWLLKLNQCTNSEQVKDFSDNIVKHLNCIPEAPVKEKEDLVNEILSLRFDEIRKQKE